MKVAVYSRPLKKEYNSYFFEFVQILESQGFSAVFSEHLVPQLRESGKDGYKTFSEPGELGDARFLLTLGGDGTILDTLSIVEERDIPVLGINLGRLGFLASVAQKELVVCLQQLKEGHYEIEERSLLYCDHRKLENVNHLALNEFTITNRDRSKLVAIRVEINGEYLNTYWADGLIIATPTGSTGYSLSCGGPVLLPDSRNFVITPIAPHNLNVRPLVVPDSATITAEVLKPTGRYLLSMDSRSASLTEGIRINFSKANKTFPLLRLSHDSFIQALRSKLLWGQDMRTFKINPK